MYINRTKATRIDPPESELISSPNEILNFIAEDIHSNQSLEPAYWATDDYNDEQIELITSEYLNQDQLDVIEIMLSSGRYIQADIINYVVIDMN